MRTVKPVKIKDYVLDGKKIYIQSMLNTRSDDIEGSVKQAIELEKAGCEIIRAAIPDKESVALIEAIKSKNASVSFIGGKKIHNFPSLTSVEIAVFT